CAVACSPRIGNSHAATPSAIARIMIGTDFNIGVSSLRRCLVRQHACFFPLGRSLDSWISNTLIWGHSRAAEQRDELAARHSITSSARSRNDSGIVRPSALAVVRLMTRSNFVG